jgi:hypothetical protein
MTSEEEHKKPAAKPKEETKTVTPTEVKKEAPVSAEEKKPGVPVVPSAASTAGAEPVGGFNESIQKALDSKLTEAVGAAFERVLNSDDFSKKVDQAIATKLLEKLGNTVPTEIRTFPVARPGTPGAPTEPTKASTVIDMTGIDPDLQDLCKVD